MDRVSTRWKVIVALVAFVGLWILYVPDFTLIVRNPDLGSQLSKGFMILSGIHPWIDIDSSVYGPAVFYFSALGQIVFPDSSLGEIILIFVGFLAAYALFFYTLDERGSSRFLFFAFVLIVLAGFPRFFKYHVLVPQAVLLFGLHQAERTPNVVVSGIKLAIACFVAGVLRLDFGAYAVLTVIVYLVLHHAGGGWRRLLEAETTFLASGFILISPWIAFLALKGDLAVIIATFFDTGRGVLRGLAKPLPAYEFSMSPLTVDNALVLLYWIFKVAPFAVLGGVLINALVRRRPPWRRNSDQYLLAAGFFAAMVYLQAGHRVDLSHVKQCVPATLFTVCLALDRMLPLMPTKGRRLVVLSSTVIAAFLVVTLGRGLLATVRTHPLAHRAEELASWADVRETALAKAAARKHGTLAGVFLKVRELTRADDAILFLPYFPQSYYMTERRFLTPHGWWNPGRFLRVGSQERFVNAMSTTRLVVDHPTYTFDGRADANARAYAPWVMRYIYSRYGIFERVGPFILLSDDPTVWSENIRFPLRFERAGFGWSEPHDSDGCGPSGYRIREVNTLPVRTMGGEFSMPQGAGLMLSVERCSKTASTACSTLALASDGIIFGIAGRGDPLPLPELEHRQLIDTRAVPPGAYHLVELPCSLPLDSTPPVVATGIRISLSSSGLK